LNNRAISLARVHNGRDGADSPYFGTWLARLLIQRSRHEMDLSAYKSALPFINEAVDIARSLFHSSPAEHRVLLGEALGWSSYALHHNDRPAASYAHAVEAAALIRVAFEANPERYRFLFALHLEELVGRSMVARRAARALPFSEEAVLLRRQIYSTSAMGKDRGWLAICLSLHSSVLLGASRAADALGVAEEAVALARETFTEPKRTSMCHYAVAADRLAEVYAALGRQDQALVTANEAVQLWRQMYQARPRGLHLAWLIGALIFVSDAAAKCGTYELARGALEEATALARTDPHGLTATERLRRLSDIHLKSSELLERLGKPEADLSAAFEAVRLSHQQLSVASDSMDVSFITARLAAQLWQVSNLSSQTEGKD
jgi:tetratricopeptide (TPR) repeat protein